MFQSWPNVFLCLVLVFRFWQRSCLDNSDSFPDVVDGAQVLPVILIRECGAKVSVQIRQRWFRGKAMSAGFFVLAQVWIAVKGTIRVPCFRWCCWIHLPLHLL
jgi:hypothetical protein